MKLAILNLTSTPVRIGVNSNATEIINICNDFNTKGHDCTVINSNKIEKIESNGLVCNLWSDINLIQQENDFGFKSIHYTMSDPNDFDAILLMNSHPNFFGGVKDEVAIEKFQWLARSKRPIFYLFNDRNLPFEQLWKQISNRKWNDLSENDVKITAPFYIISQFSDESEVLKLNNKYGNVLGCKFIDFGVWMLTNYKDKFITNKSEYDLIYGGSFRGGRREPKFRDFFFNKNLNVAIYGTMKLSNYKDQTNPPSNWLGKVSCDKVITENSLGLSTIIVGERGYNNHINIIRQYESIFGGCITFIDNDFDSKHIIYPDNDFLYIHSGDELENKINLLKTNKSIYDRCIDAQNAFIERKSKIDYISEIINYIQEVK